MKKKKKYLKDNDVVLLEYEVRKLQSELNSYKEKNKLLEQKVSNLKQLAKKALSL